MRTNTVASSATGTVRMLDVDLEVGEALSLGVVDALPGIDPFSSATGALETTAGANADGHVIVGTDVRIGVSANAPAIATAMGTASIAGDLTGRDVGTLSVGEVRSIGDGNGTLEVSGDLSGFTAVSVGRTRLLSTGDARGDLTVNAFEVGTTNGDGDVNGVANVNGGVSGYQFYEVGITRTNSLGNAVGTLAVQDGPVTGSRMRVGVSEGAGTAIGGRLAVESAVALAWNLWPPWPGIRTLWTISSRQTWTSATYSAFGDCSA